MKLFLYSLLYTVLIGGVNPLYAQTLNPDALRDMRTGDMRKLVIHDAPKPLRDETFQTIKGKPLSLRDFFGKTLLVNFWATWCAPCRAEMPALDALNRHSNDGFEVITIATGRNPPAKIDAFFKESKITSLPKYIDPTMTYARNFGVFGLPISVIVNKDGHEIARLQGEADWNSQDAKEILAALGRRIDY